MAKFQILPIEKQICEMIKSEFNRLDIMYIRKYTNKNKRNGDLVRSHKFFGLFVSNVVIETKFDLDVLIKELNEKIANITPDYFAEFIRTNRLIYTSVDLVVRHR